MQTGSLSRIAIAPERCLRLSICTYTMKSDDPRSSMVRSVTILRLCRCGISHHRILLSLAPNRAPIFTGGARFGNQSFYDSAQT